MRKRKLKLKGDGPRVHVWWCDLGCGAETTTPGPCTKCGGRTVDLGWRAGNHRAVFVYYSTQEGAA